MPVRKENAAPQPTTTGPTIVPLSGMPAPTVQGSSAHVSNAPAPPMRPPTGRLRVYSIDRIATQNAKALFYTINLAASSNDQKESVLSLQLRLQRLQVLFGKDARNSKFLNLMLTAENGTPIHCTFDWPLDQDHLSKLESPCVMEIMFSGISNKFAFGYSVRKYMDFLLEIFHHKELELVFKD